MDFEVIGEISAIERIASGSRLRRAQRLRRDYGAGNWVKRKGVARVRLEDGTMRTAKVHWYEAHSVGRKALKVKRLIEWP